MYTDEQLKDLGFHRPRRREAGYSSERHLIVGGWKFDWPDAITKNSTKPRLIIRGRKLFLVPNKVWRQMNYHRNADDEHFAVSYYLKTMWQECSCFNLPMFLSDLKLFVEDVQNGNWIEPDFYK